MVKIEKNKIINISMIKIEGRTFSLENDFIARRIVFDEGGLHTTSFFNKTAGKEYAKPTASVEFMLRLQNKTIFGYKERVRHILDGNISDRDYNLSLVNAEALSVSPGIERLKVSLQVAEIDVKVNVYYEIKRKLCGTSKWLELISGVGDLSVNGIIFDVINACPGEFVDVEYYRQSGLMRLELLYFNGYGIIICISKTTIDRPNGKIKGRERLGTAKYLRVPLKKGDDKCMFSFNSILRELPVL